MIRLLHQLRSRDRRGGARASLVLATTAASLVLAGMLAIGIIPTMAGRALNPVVSQRLPEPSPEARELHRSLHVADLHGDALLWDRDLLRRGTWGHVDLPRLTQGRVAVQAFTTVTKTPRGLNIEANRGDSDNVTLLAALQGWPAETWSSLAARALHQADKLHSMARDSRGRLRVVTTVEELDSALAARRRGDPVTAAFLGIEGAHALDGDVANVDRLFEAGFRMFGLTHFFDNEVGGSAHGVVQGGLTPLGRQVMDRMDQLGIMVDVAHASPALIDDVINRGSRPVVVSHGGVKGTCENQRNLEDRHLRAIAATGGVMGVGLWETAVCGTTPADWARAVRHAVEVMGVDHVGLGSDWDGAITAIVDASGTVHLVQALLDEGFDADAIGKIMGGNVIRVLREALPPA